MAKRTKKYVGCISKIEDARSFARESFVYGMKTKDDYWEISPRAYDETTRRMGDWFQDCLHTRTVKVRNKIKYLSLDCREHSLNPLYKMWKSHTFNTNDIVFFFSLLEILSDQHSVSFKELCEEYGSIHRTGGFSQGNAQIWLKNKVLPSGIVVKQERGNYCLGKSFELSPYMELLQFYSEIAPSGVIGSFILDKQEKQDLPFRFKQHYIGQAFDCEVICNALHAIKNKRKIDIIYQPKGKDSLHLSVFPVKVYSSTQSGRQYLIAWDENTKRFFNYRLDRVEIVSVSESVFTNADSIQAKFKDIKKHIWGISFGNGNLIHVEMVIKAEKNEAYIIKRLHREKRCGKVSVVDEQKGIYKFEADVYDAHELFPWIRTFVCRIVDLEISDKEIEKQFWNSIYEMNKLYTTGGDQV